MDYRRADRIGNMSLGQLAARLMEKNDSGILSSVGEAAKMKIGAAKTRLVSKIDPMNIARVLTGSPLGAAVVGKLTGRKSRDISYFTGGRYGSYGDPTEEEQTKAKKTRESDGVYTSTIGPGKATKLKAGDGMADILAKLYNLVYLVYVNDMKGKKLERAFAEEREDEAERALRKEKLKKEKVSDTPKPEDSSFFGKFFSGLLGNLLKNMTGILKSLGNLLIGILAAFFNPLKKLFASFFTRLLPILSGFLGEVAIITAAAVGAGKWLESIYTIFKEGKQNSYQEWAKTNMTPQDFAVDPSEKPEDRAKRLAKRALEIQENLKKEGAEFDSEGRMTKAAPKKERPKMMDWKDYLGALNKNIVIDENGVSIADEDIGEKEMLEQMRAAVDNQIKIYGGGSTPESIPSTGSFMDRYMALTRMHEGNYDSDPKVGYVGAYGIGSEALETLGYLKPGASKRYNKNSPNAAIYHPEEWQNGWSLEKFLASHETQDAVMAKLTAMNMAGLKKSGVITDNMSESEIASRLLAAHHGGVGNANKYFLEGKDTADYKWPSSTVGKTAKWAEMKFRQSSEGMPTLEQGNAQTNIQPMTKPKVEPMPKQTNPLSKKLENVQSNYKQDSGGQQSVIINAPQSSQNYMMGAVNSVNRGVAMFSRDSESALLNSNLRNLKIANPFGK